MKKVDIEGLWVFCLIGIVMMFDSCSFHAEVIKKLEGHNQAIHGIWKELEKQNVGK